MANGPCLICESRNLSIGDCPFRRTGNIVLAPQELLAPPVRRNLGPTGRGVSLTLQRHAYDQAQRGARAGVGRERSQTYNLTAEEAEALDEVVVGCGARCPDQEP